MGDLISRSALIKCFDDYCVGQCCCCPYENDEYECGLIKNAPAVDAVPVVHGEWIEKPGMPGCLVRYKCSVCGETEPLAYKFDYCPHCGATMDGKKNTNLLFADMEEIIDATD